ncbi:unnamed protein product [Trifolium pratense]|uniref:Uncharacterized protein n=1 Tax=Trifolium pratense TaxID=57577 RepID=A0ACB0KFL2_TRIPR|nr:unnamed protein product [Trifolium pratense]
MAEVLGSFVSALISSAVDKISVQELKDFFRGYKIDDQILQNLKMHLLSVSTVLSDAEEKQFCDPYVKEWVDKLKNTAYDADDLLDEIVTKGKYKARGFAPSLNVFSERPQSRVEDIVERLKTLVEFIDILGLKKGGIGKSLSYVSATTSLVDESRVYGRTVDKEKIIDFLLSENSNNVGVAVGAIVGMRGIGKTTLAQVLYNNERVMNHFQSRSWASVSESMDMHEITKQVLESFMLCQYKGEGVIQRDWLPVATFNAIQVLLKHTLTRKRFLLVLDGFEHDNYLDWDNFLKPFQSAKCGSKIILTTRSTRVATGIRADLTHSLPFLSHEDSWELFWYHAFMAKTPNQRSCDLIEAGNKIVKRCEGLPLALITLGSLLYSKEDNEEWENVSKSTLVDLSRGKRNIFSELISSYVDLPSHLKQCFAFCAIYPRDVIIDKWKLIYLWMAEGVLPRTPGKRMEEIGEECFEELVSNSFLRCISQENYLMHNLMHELSECVAGDFCYKLDDSDPKTIEMNSVRHISYLQGVYEKDETFETYDNCTLLRTFLPFNYIPFVDRTPICASIPAMLSKTKKLRVLSLARYDTRIFPDSVGGLMYLRYLDLSNTLISSLPDSICSFYNLETLLLVRCTHLKLLPSKISNLINLRQLDISDSGVEKMPANFGKLKCLQLLPCFVVGDDGGSNVSELGELSGLHGSLSIVNLQNVLTGEEASNAGLNKKKNLHEVTFNWTSATHNQQSENMVIDKLNPHPKLRRLKIYGFGGDKFPSWQLESSSISSGHRSESESLTLLKELYIEKCPNLTGKLPDNLPSLTKLVIKSCPTLQDSMPWVPRLRELNITSCETFVSLPEAMMKGNQDIESIIIESCPSLVSIPTNDMSRTISCLKISWCGKLELFPQVENSHCYHVLQRLHLKRSCDSLAVFQFSLFPKLEDLSIEDCPALETFLSTANILPSLQKLNLKGCTKLVLFSQGDFPAMPSLTSIQLNGLSNLTSLENIGMNCLTSLKTLKIEDCINLGSLPPVSSLVHLNIKSCPILKKECESDTGKYKSMVSLIHNTVIED